MDLGGLLFSVSLVIKINSFQFSAVFAGAESCNNEKYRCDHGVEMMKNTGVVVVCFLLCWLHIFGAQLCFIALRQAFCVRGSPGPVQEATDVMKWCYNSKILALLPVEDFDTDAISNSGEQHCWPDSPW